MPPGTSSAIVCSPPSGLAFDPRAATLLARAAHSLLLGARARRSPATPPSRALDAAAHVKYPSAPDALVRFRSTSVLTPVASVLAPLVPLRRRENANSLDSHGHNGRQGHEGTRVELSKATHSSHDFAMLR